MKKTSMLITCAAVLLTAFGSAHADLIVNGSFEDDPQAAGTWNIYGGLTGWTTGKYGIELRNNVAGAAYDDVNYIELDTTSNSFASQAIGTEAIQYLLSFAYSPRINRPEATNGIEVWWDGALQGLFTGDGGSTHNWQVFNLYVLGGSTESTLMFRAVGNSDSYGGSLDAVSIRAVPEPTTLALLGLGLVGVGFGRRKLTR